MILKIPFTFPYKSVLDLHPNCWEIAYCIDTQKQNTIIVTIIKSPIRDPITNSIVDTASGEVRYLSYNNKEEMELAYRFLEANLG